MTTTLTRQPRGRGRLLGRVVLIVLAFAVVGVVADRAITSFTPRSWSRGTLTGTLEAPTLSVGPSGRFTVHPVVGTYTVTATTPQYEGGKGTCRASGPVTVREGVKATVTVECQKTQ